MDDKLHDFAKPVGMKAAGNAIEAYKQRRGEEFQESWEGPMLYASGFTAAHLTDAFAKNWIIPLRNRLRTALAGNVIAALLLGISGLYLWSVLDFSAFSRFLVVFIPSVAALLFSLAKTYKTLAEAKKLWRRQGKLKAQRRSRRVDLARLMQGSLPGPRFANKRVNSDNQKRRRCALPLSAAGYA